MLTPAASPRPRHRLLRPGGWPGAARRATAAALTAVVLLAAGCTGGGQADPREVLDAAAARLAAVEAVHVEVSSADLPQSGSVLVAASGDARRPAAFSGTLQLRTAGISADVDVLSTGGQVYARLPFTAELAPVDPEELGFRDPAALLDPDDGIVRLLEAATALEDLGEERLDGEVVQRVGASIPGEPVAALLTSADPTLPFSAVLSVGEDDEIRRVELVGPFYDAGVDTTYTVALTRWDEPVEIPSPPDGG